MKPTIAVDFDGVIHSYISPWTRATEIPDAPVPGAMAWLSEMVKHFDVVVYTTRADEQENPGGAQAVQDWIVAHGGPGLRVVAGKPVALVYIDDRACRFEGAFPSAHEIHQMKPWNKR